MHDFRHSVAPSRRDAEHRRKQVAGAARLEEFSLRSPAIPAAETVRLLRHAIGNERAVVVIAGRIEIGGAATEDGAIEHRQASQRCGGEMVLLLELSRQFVGEVDPPGEVG